MLINGVGKQRPRLRIVEANVASHVRGKPGWDCVIAVYATEDELPSRRLARLAEVCHIHRDPGKGWGQLLRSLTPAVARCVSRHANQTDNTAPTRMTTRIPRSNWRMACSSLPAFDPYR